MAEKKGFWKKAMEKRQELIENSDARLQELEEKQHEQERQLNQKAGITLLYLGGHPKIKSGKKGKEITVKTGSEENMLILNKFEVKVTGLEWDEQGKRSLGKAAAGTIIGGVLTGGVGAVAGAAIGGRKKDNSIAVVKVIDNEVEYTVYFRCSSKEYSKLTSML